MADTSRLDTQPTTGVVGVRFRSAARVAFFRAPETALEVGSWVLAGTPGGLEPARVVIAPDQLIHADCEGELLPIERVLDAGEVARMEPLPRVEQSEHAIRLVGGLGRRGGGDSRRSRENEDYLRAKAMLPRLGEQVTTPVGDGMVVALQIHQGQAKVRLAEDGRVEVFPTAVITSGAREL